MKIRLFAVLALTATTVWISPATRGFSAVARIARPSRVLLTRNISDASATTVTTRMTICVVLITAPPMK